MLREEILHLPIGNGAAKSRSESPGKGRPALDGRRRSGLHGQMPEVLFALRFKVADGIFAVRRAQGEHPHMVGAWQWHDTVMREKALGLTPAQTLDQGHGALVAAPAAASRRQCGAVENLILPA